MPRGGARPGTGGARQGSGAKSLASKISDTERRKLLKALKAKSAFTGKNWQEVLADLAYDEKVQDSVRLGALGRIQEALLVKESHQQVDGDVRHRGVVILPEMDDDPADAPGSQEGEA